MESTFLVLGKVDKTSGQPKGVSVAATVIEVCTFVPAGGGHKSKKSGGSTTTDKWWRKRGWNLRKKEMERTMQE